MKTIKRIFLWAKKIILTAVFLIVIPSMLLFLLTKIVSISLWAKIESLYARIVSRR